MRHTPVLVKELLEQLKLAPGNNVIDCTVGDGGHAEEILKATSPAGKLLAIDADPESLLRAKQHLYQFGNRVVYERNNFAWLEKIIMETGFAEVKAVVMDLGWSSPQFEERGRGFSFKKQESLDMRYDPLAKTATAADIINTYSEQDLAKLLRINAEEELSKEIAYAVVKQRKVKQIDKTTELVKVVLDVYKNKLKSNHEVPFIGGLHPATKVFQALRVEVNHELDALKQALPQAIRILKQKGKLAVISFHSLEDRIVKQYFKSIEGVQITLINKKPIIADQNELKINPRARSAKLRVVEKL